MNRRRTYNTLAKRQKDKTKISEPQNTTHKTKRLNNTLTINSGMEKNSPGVCRVIYELKHIKVIRGTLFKS